MRKKLQFDTKSLSKELRPIVNGVIQRLYVAHSAAEDFRWDGAVLITTKEIHLKTYRGPDGNPLPINKGTLDPLGRYVSWMGSHSSEIKEWLPVNTFPISVTKHIHRFQERRMVPDASHYKKILRGSGNDHGLFIVPGGHPLYAAFLLWKSECKGNMQGKHVEEVNSARRNNFINEDQRRAALRRALGSIADYQFEIEDRR
jgi:hypothetical protein